MAFKLGVLGPLGAYKPEIVWMDSEELLPAVPSPDGRSSLPRFTFPQFNRCESLEKAEVGPDSTASQGQAEDGAAPLKQADSTASLRQAEEGAAPLKRVDSLEQTDVGAASLQWLKETAKMVPGGWGYPKYGSGKRRRSRRKAFKSKSII